jgi:DNA replication and repair protein RecF
MSVIADLLVISKQRESLDGKISSNHACFGIRPEVLLDKRAHNSIITPMLSHLLVRDFRCFEEAQVELHPETTILVGQNAQGKTSLLEAACVLLRLQSPRTSTRGDWIRFAAKAAIVEGRLGDTKMRFAQSQAARRLAVNESVCVRAQDYLQHTGLVVWMDHSDMLLVRGGAENRRRYLDFAAAQLFSNYLPALRNYERALRSRNHVLKRDVVINWRQAEAYAKIMSEHGGVLRECRADMVERLRPHMAAAHHELSSSLEEAALTYMPGFEGENLELALREVRLDEERSRTTATGPHRDDLKLLLNGRDAGSFASEGQQRTLSLALKLAQARVLEEGRGQPPLLLMDDIFGELDKARRQALLGALPKHGQKIITTTFLDWAGQEEIPGCRYSVQQGRLQLLP